MNATPDPARRDRPLGSPSPPIGAILFKCRPGGSLKIQKILSGSDTSLDREERRPWAANTAWGPGCDHSRGGCLACYPRTFEPVRPCRRLMRAKAVTGPRLDRNKNRRSFVGFSGEARYACTKWPLARVRSYCTGGAGDRDRCGGVARIQHLKAAVRPRPMPVAAFGARARGSVCGSGTIPLAAEAAFGARARGSVRRSSFRDRLLVAAFKPDHFLPSFNESSHPTTVELPPGARQVRCAPSPRSLRGEGGERFSASRVRATRAACVGRTRRKSA